MLQPYTLRVVSWALGMVPYPPLKGSDVWALNLYRVRKGYIRGPLLRDHATALRHTCSLKPQHQDWPAVRELMSCGKLSSAAGPAI